MTDIRYEMDRSQAEMIVWLSQHNAATKFLNPFKAHVDARIERGDLLILKIDWDEISNKATDVLENEASDD